MLLVSLVVPLTEVRCDQESEDVSLSLRAYAPARILISYTYTNNFSVSDISSVGLSLYKITSGPTSIEFRAEEVDQYTFSIELLYAVSVAQGIQIAIFSSGNPPEALQFNVNDDEIRVKFTLTVTEEPMYPSAQEVAEQVVNQVSDQLANFETQTEKIVDLQNRNITFQWYLLMFVLVVNVANLLALLLVIRPRFKKTA